MNLQEYFLGREGVTTDQLIEEFMVCFQYLIRSEKNTLKEERVKLVQEKVEFVREKNQ